MERTRIRDTLIALLLAAALGYSEQGVDLEPGILIEKVTTKNDPEQSYALYLPRSYTAERPWPILYCFDPRARGTVAVERFKAAAEEHGLIVVGSNNARNGPMDVIGRAIIALWNDTHLRFAINENLIYAAGFSGGAQVALGLGPSLNRKIAGIIACSRGLPEGIRVEMLAGTAIFCTAGTTDFNYREVEAFDGLLATAGVPHRTEFFAGPHAWASESLLAEGLRWQVFQAMKVGKIPRDQQFMDSIFNLEDSRAREASEKGRVVESARLYECLKSDFGGLRQMTEIDEEIRRLKGSPEFTKQVKNEKKLAEKEQNRLTQLRSVFGRINDPSLEFLTSGRFVNEFGIPGLKKEAAKGPEDVEGAMAARLLAELFDNTMNAGDAYMAKGDCRRAAVLFEVSGEISPDIWAAWYNAACAHACQKNKKAALQMLSRAVEKGFDDRDHLASDPDLAALREEEEFKALLEKLPRQP
ncbi:MAG: hypothetical protein AB1714_05955 [Acidobacteriota bacterium]